MKRLISILLIATFVLTAVSAIGVSAAPKYTTSFMTSLLYDIGCVDNVNGMDEQITLREFEQSANRLRGFDGESITDSNDNVALIQAVRVLVDNLGYKVKLKNYTDYDYIVCANQIGLLRNMTKNQNEIITKSDAHILLFNALTIRHLERTSFGSSETYEESEKTFLKDVFNVRIVSGIVVGVHQSIGSSAKETVRILTSDYGTVGFTFGSLDIYNSLGMRVSAYVKLSSKNSGEITSDDLDGEAIFSYINDTNEIFTVKRSDLLSYDADANQIEYKDSNNRVFTKSTADDITVIYNGKVSDTNTTLKGTIDGFTHFIDNNNDGRFDYAVIWDLHEFYVDAAYTETKTIRSKFNLKGSLLELSSGKNFKIDKDKYFFIIEKGGKRHNIKDIKKGDVLSIAISEDKKFVKISIFSNVVEGKIEEMVLVKSSDTELNLSDTVLVINEKSYKLSKEFYNGVKTSSGMLPYKIGNSGKFFLNYDGKIAYADISVSKDKYGYILEATASSSLNASVRVNILTSDNEWIIYELDDHVTLNSDRLKKSEIARNGFTGIFNKTADDIEAVRQLVQYRVTSDDKIDRIKTPKIGHDADSFTLDHDYTTNTKRYLSKGDQIGDSYITSNTLVFNIDDSKPLTSKDSYSVTNKDYFVDKTSYRIYIYDKDKDFNSDAVVVYGPKSVVNQQTKLSVVKSLSVALNSKEETKTKVTFIQNNEEKSYLLPDSVNTENLQKGVVFQYSLKNSDEILQVDIIDDLNSLSDYYITGDMEVSDKFMLVYGTANVRTSTIGVKTNDSNMRYKVDDSTSIYQYDKSTKKISFIDLSSIENDSKVLVKITNCKATDIIKIK